MKCKCGGDTDVTDSRYDATRNTVRRRRRCLSCGERWGTYEVHTDELKSFARLANALDDIKSIAEAVSGS